MQGNLSLQGWKSIFHLSSWIWGESSLILKQNKNETLTFGALKVNGENCMLAYSSTSQRAADAWLFEQLNDKWLAQREIILKGLID